MEELHKKLLHWMMVERADGTKPWICFDDGGGGDGGGGDGGGGDDGGGDDGDDDDDDDGQDGGDPAEPAEPDPEANFDFSPTPTLEPGVTVELSAKGQEVPEVTAAPTTAVTQETLPDIPGTTPEITLPEITVTGSQPSDKEVANKEEGPPNAAPSNFGTFDNFASLVENPSQPSVFDLPTGAQPPEKSLDELFNDLTKEPSSAPPPEPSPPAPGIFENAINAVTAAIVGQAQAASPVNPEILQQGQAPDLFGTKVEPGSKIEEQMPQGVPGIDFVRPDPSSPTKSEDTKEQSPFDIQNAAFNTFGVNPGFFGSQPVEPSGKTDRLDIAQPAPAPSAPPIEPTSVPTTSVAPGQVEREQFGVPAQQAAAPQDRFEGPPQDRLEMPSAPQSVFDLNTPNPAPAPQEVAKEPSPFFDPNPAMAAPPWEVAQAPQAPQDLTERERDILFNPAPMNPPAPVVVAQTPVGQKGDKENPSTREFDPAIFDPKTYEPSVPTAYAPAPGPPPEIPGMPGQPGPPGPTSVAGPPAGVPSGVPGSVAGTNDDMIPVTLPGQRLALTPDMQRQKAIKAKRDAIALAMMRNPNDPAATGGGSLGYNGMLGIS